MVTTPDDDTPQTFSPMMPAIPSRAAGEAPLPPKPMFEDAPVPRKPRKKSTPQGRAAKRAQRLPSREIKRINTNRRKNVAKKKSKLAPKPAKNRNRPLEAKNRLHAVLGAVAAMSKAEALAFTGVMQHLEDMARPARKRIIEALSQVYA